jgi:hypothetical protein
MIVITNLTSRIKVAITAATDPYVRTEYFQKGKLNIWSVGDTVYLTDTTKEGKYIATIPYTLVSGAVSASALITTILGYDDAYSPTTNVVTSNVITSAAVISAITTEANWTPAFSDPGGIIALMGAGQIYYDMTNKIKYEFDGTHVIRYSFDNIG